MKKLFLLIVTFTLVLSGIGVLGTNDIREVGATTTSGQLPGGKNYIEFDNIIKNGGNTWIFEDPVKLKADTTYTLGMNVDLFPSGETATLLLETNGSATYYDDFIYEYGCTNSSTVDSKTICYITFNTNGKTGDDLMLNFILDFGGSYDYHGAQIYDMIQNDGGLSSEHYIQLEEGSTPTSYEEYQAPVLDTINPIINGATGVYHINVDNPDTVADLKATLTATDNKDGDITANITIPRDTYTGNEGTLGDYEVDFSVSDNAGNTTTVTITMRVVDVVDPIINLLGGTTIHLEYAATWTDPGYTASDNYDSSVTVNTSGTVNTSVLGTYTINYNATDTSGNAATQKTRSVIVEDTTIPVITLSGDSTVYIEFGDNFTDPGATCSDNYDGSCTAVKTGSVNVGVLGTYTIRYNYTDSNGNIAAEKVRTVVVRDTTAPSIIGNTSYTYDSSQAVSVYSVLQNITSTDVYDGNMTDSIVIVSNTLDGNEGTVGVYTINISVTDSQGNIATETITVNIIDNEKPVFTTSAQIFTHEYADNMTQQDLKDLFGVS